MKIKSSLILIAGMSLASITHTQAGTTQLNTNGTWSITNGNTTQVSWLNVTGTSGASGKISTNNLSTEFLNATKESNFNGVTIGRGDGELQYNTAIGFAVLDGGSAASGNAVTGVGSYALQKNTSGGSNTAVGHAAMQYNTAGTTNTASGIYALRNNTVGSENTATGANSLVANTSGNFNTAIGNLSLVANQTGQYNTAIGYQSSGQNQGSSNTTLGVNSLYFNTLGDLNVAIGKDAAVLQNNGAALLKTIGSTYIGANSRGYSDADYNSIVIGAGAWGEGANTTVIGNGATKSTHLYGKTISDSLQVNGNTVLSGTVILAQPQGDISMGAYQ